MCGVRGVVSGWCLSCFFFFFFFFPCFGCSPSLHDWCWNTPVLCSGTLRVNVCPVLTLFIDAFQSCELFGFKLQTSNNEISLFEVQI
jgi:hypothetical protein